MGFEFLVWSLEFGVTSSKLETLNYKLGTQNSKLLDEAQDE